jgi:predicted house-cleaning noncanonical NTP pyrophosphatase (MazG superfamily)
MRVDYNKLVRDQIPEIIAASGRRPATRVLDGASYRDALRAKLVEEAREAADAAPGDLLGELADIIEVIMALTATSGSSWEQLLDAAARKRAQRGGFQNKIFLEPVDDPA